VVLLGFMVGMMILWHYDCVYSVCLAFWAGTYYDTSLVNDFPTIKSVLRSIPDYR
jgi:hypothetical protein